MLAEHKTKLDIVLELEQVTGMMGGVEVTASFGSGPLTASIYAQWEP